MDEWDKIVEGLLPYDANFGGECARLRREAVAAKLREMGEEAKYRESQLLEDVAMRTDLVNAALEDIAQLKAERDAAYQEVERSGSAISETLRLADFLAEAAARGAGFADHWGERVTQAVEPLRDTKAFESQTLQQNKVLLDANGKFLRERDEARADRDAAYLEGLEEGKDICDRYGSSYFANLIQSRIDEAKGK